MAVPVSEMIVAIRVLLADDQVPFRKEIRALLEGVVGFEIVGEAGDGVQAQEQCASAVPDIVLMSIGMPVCTGIEATLRIKSKHARTKVLMLATSADDNFLDALRAGADAYVLRNLGPQAIVDTIRRVHGGETLISPAVVGKLVDEFRRDSRRKARRVAGRELTAREKQILRCVADGLNNRDIGARLDMAEGTVKNHLHHILDKLRLENRVQAAAFKPREEQRKAP